MRLGPHALTVLRGTERQSDYGNRSELDWSTPESTVVSGCSVQPAPSDEYAIDRDSITTRLLAYLPPDTDIRATDRVQWSGQTYDIDGDVLRWDFGALSHLVVNLRRSVDE